MTVAPMMPMAKTTIPGSRNPGLSSAAPIAAKSGCVCGKTKISIA